MSVCLHALKTRIVSDPFLKHQKKVKSRFNSVAKQMGRKGQVRPSLVRYVLDGGHVPPIETQSLKKSLSDLQKDQEKLDDAAEKLLKKQSFLEEQMTKLDGQCGRFEKLSRELEIKTNELSRLEKNLQKQTDVVRNLQTQLNDEKRKSKKKVQELEIKLETLQEKNRLKKQSDISKNNQTEKTLQRTQKSLNNYKQKLLIMDKKYKDLLRQSDYIRSLYKDTHKKTQLVSTQKKNAESLLKSKTEELSGFKERLKDTKKKFIQFQEKSKDVERQLKKAKNDNKNLEEQKDVAEEMALQCNQNINNCKQKMSEQLRDYNELKEQYDTLTNYLTNLLQRSDEEIISILREAR